jgi:large subunit ribosomal protein L31
MISGVLQVFCNGEEVLTVSGTKKSYTVDVWSGNHPFFTGSNQALIVDEGRVNKFQKRFQACCTIISSVCFRRTVLHGNVLASE